MSEMIERVAKAIAKQNNASEWDRIDEDDVFDRGYLLRRDYLAFASAAIEAMREPTEPMADAFMPYPISDGSKEEWYGGMEKFKASWSAAIAAATS